ncbi:MAG: hypothetical protein AB7L71_02170 [Vicinamibacterales bacterium]|jgi:hypothetical protein
MISRSLIILLAIGAGLYRITTGATLEGIGLLSMAAGLLALKGAAKRPAYKALAFLFFAVTGAIIGFVLWRNTQ